MQHIILLTTTSILLLLGCGDATVLTEPEPCAISVEIDDQIYDQAKSASFSIQSSSLNGNCLQLVISSSGCDGARWVTSLYGSTAIAESSPEQRYIRLILENDEECDAVIERDYEFDISPLQIENNGQLIINLQGLDETISYEY